MSKADAWDWPVLMYVSTVILHRPEKLFWRTTPRKLNALTKAHTAMNPTGDESGSTGSQPKMGYIDQVLGG